MLLLQGSTAGISSPYNVHHQAHATEQDGQVIISKPTRPPPMKLPHQAKSSSGDKVPPPKRPPPPKQQASTGKPPRPPLPVRK